MHLYISWYVTVNKPVLSYLHTYCCAFFHSGDPDQVVPFVLYTAPLYTLLTCRQLHELVALSSAFVSDTFVQLLWCTLHWLQLNKRFSLSISLRNPQTFHLSSVCHSVLFTWYFPNLLSLPHFLCLLNLSTCKHSVLLWLLTSQPTPVLTYISLLAVSSWFNITVFCSLP
jgi:hypothetical protein